MSQAVVRRVSIAAPEFKHFPEFPDGFRPGIMRLRRALGCNEDWHQHL